MKTIRVNPGNSVKPIKPLNGVGGGPVTDNFSYDTSDCFRAAGIPFSRTHDIEYPLGSGEYVDIHCVFPDFDKDVDDPASYNFIFTDEYLKAICAAGAKPLYRLGSTIEHQPIKRYIHPPKDSEKWGKICSHIIAHYNEGWADGFHMGIEYWEIWNEPDLVNRCWTGTEEQFFALYDAAASIIKKEHPSVKIGGCGFTSPFSGMTERFLAHISESGAPFDFFSWHGYIHTPEQAAQYSAKAEALMNQYGFSDAESIYDEWNYVVAWGDMIQASIDLHKTALCASFMTSVMSVLQNGRTDISCYYDVQVLMQNWNGVFTPGRMIVHGETIPVIVEKPYYALKAWHMLAELGKQAEVTVDGNDIFCTAATDGKKIALLITSYNDDAGYGKSKPETEEITLDFGGAGLKNAEIRRISDADTFEAKPFSGSTVTLEGNTFVLITGELDR